MPKAGGNVEGVDVLPTFMLVSHKVWRYREVFGDRLDEVNALILTKKRRTKSWNKR